MITVCAKRCEQCLFGPTPIPRPDAIKAYIRKARAKDVAFSCHVSTLAHNDVACRGWFDMYGRKQPWGALRAALMLAHAARREGVELEPVVFVDAATLVPREPLPPVYPWWKEDPCPSL